MDNTDDPAYLRELTVTTIGTPLSPSGTKVLMLGSGELGKEVVLELQRFGCEVIAGTLSQRRPQCSGPSLARHQMWMAALG